MIDIGWNTDRLDADQTIGRLFEAAFGPLPGQFDQVSLFGWKPIVEDDHRSSGLVWPGGVGFVFDRLDEVEYDHVDTEIFETSDDIVIRIVMPGIKKESLYIEVSGNILTLTGKRVAAGSELAAAGETLMPFKKVFNLPKTPMPGDVRAKYTGTILHIQISKNLV